MAAKETAPARGELRPSSQESPWAGGDPCCIKTPSGHSFHFEIRTACRETRLRLSVRSGHGGLRDSCIGRSVRQRRAIQAPGQARIADKEFLLRMALGTFIGWRAPPTRRCFGRASRRSRSPIRRSQRAAEQDTVQVFASFPNSVLESQSPSAQSVPGAWYEQ